MATQPKEDRMGLLTIRQHRQCMSFARIVCIAVLLLIPALSQGQMLGDPVDVSQDFQNWSTADFLDQSTYRTN
jgi:hypothetical protein